MTTPYPPAVAMPTSPNPPGRNTNTGVKSSTPELSSKTSRVSRQIAKAIGTAQYLPPEQDSGEEVDGRADVYSPGCVLYEMLTVEEQGREENGTHA